LQLPDQFRGDLTPHSAVLLSCGERAAVALRDDCSVCHRIGSFAASRRQIGIE
jgi:hypothetical protein